MHFPYCKHLCNYCDFYKLKLDDDKRQIKFAQLEKYLNQSFGVLLDTLAQKGSSITTLETIYFGGGTPSLWGAEGIEYIKKLLVKHNLTLEQNYEWTLEVNPGATSREELTQWQKLGVNRFSFGVQTLNPQIFPLMDRSHSLDKVYELFDSLSDMKVNFSVDFMLGLPQSDTFNRSIEVELDKILSYNPSHISLYFLTVPKKYVHYDSLPSEDWMVEEYLQVVKLLKSYGFEHYEVASFAKPGYSSKHNIKYWKHQSVFALGPSATGFLAYEDEEGPKHLRYKWSNNWQRDEVAKYELENLNLEEYQLEKVYLTLRQGVFFKLDDFYQMGFQPERLLKLFSRWKECGYIEFLNLAQAKMTANGWLILDALVQEILTTKSPTPS